MPFTQASYSHGPGAPALTAVTAWSEPRPGGAPCPAERAQT